MHVSLTPELDNIVKQHVESGFNSSSEVVRDKKKVEALRTRLELAEKSPLVENFSMDELIKELDQESD